VGVGGREEDYRAVDAVCDGKRLGRLEEQVGLIRRAWAGESVVEGALRPVEPGPVQPGGPEILAASLFPRSIRRAARWADGLCSFSFGPSADEVGGQFEMARAAWEREARGEPPRLVTGFWFALGEGGRAQMDEYLQRYLNFMGPGVAEKLAPTVTTTSSQALRDAVRMIEDLGADELILAPTTSDPDEVHRVADILG
jgi:alkanesulfonate monooxygenase SsuD/methylene tetrahydromethanopterin reductase-like flavin-dependent oxidoreductase (luciferase family)